MSRKTKITLPTTIEVGMLAEALVREMSDDALLKLFKDVDKLTADWGFTKKIHQYFDAEMKFLAEEERKDHAHG